MVLYYGDPAAIPTYFSPWKDFTAGLRELSFFWKKDMASADVLQRAQWPTLSIYYKLAIFICLHNAFHDRLPVTLIDLISEKRVTNYSTWTCASLIVPRFNTRYMKDSVAFRGSVLWNAVTNNCSDLLRTCWFMRTTPFYRNDTTSQLEHSK